MGMGHSCIRIYQECDWVISIFGKGRSGNGSLPYQDIAGRVILISGYRRNGPSPFQSVAGMGLGYHHIRKWRRRNGLLPYQNVAGMGHNHISI